MGIGWLFGEVFCYRGDLVKLLCLTNVITVGPKPEEVSAQNSDRMLFTRGSIVCCDISKVDPLTLAFEGFGSWIPGRKSYQGEGWNTLDGFVSEGNHIKINPPVGWGKAKVEAYREEFNLPVIPMGLLDSGQ